MTFWEYLWAGSWITKWLWHLNWNSNDASGNGNNWTDANITYWLPYWKFWQGALFNGSSSKITISDWSTLDLTGDSTYSMRVNVAAAPWSWLQYRLRDNNWWGSPYWMYISYINLAPLSLSMAYWTAGSSGSTVATQTLTTGTWYHIVFTHDSVNDTDAIYVNGSLIKSEAWKTQNPTDKASNKYIGCEDGTGKWFNGWMDEIIVENRVWSAAYVKKYYTYAKWRFWI
jgi:hypothetical protein